MKIFLVSNSYIEYELSINFKFNKLHNINNIYLLKENHFSCDFQKHGDTIVLCDNADEAIQKCDVVIIIKYDMAMNYDRIFRLCEKYEKKYYQIEWMRTKEKENLSSIRTSSINSKIVPVIVNICIGTYHQQQTIEVNLCNSFDMLQVNYCYKVSALTNDFLNIIYDLDGSSTKGKPLNSESDVAFISIAYPTFKELLQDTLFTHLLNRLLPDYMIVALDDDRVSMKDIQNIFKIRYGVSNISYVVSKYRKIIAHSRGDEGYLFRNDNPFSGYCDVYSCEDVNLSILFDRIISKIALPQDVTIF